MSGEENDFTENQAEESSDDTSSEDSEDDDEEEGDDDGEEGDDDEEEGDDDEEEGDDGTPVEGLIDDIAAAAEEQSESEEEEDEDNTGGSRKRRQSFDDQLEDEDYDLIAENTGLQLQRKKFRRIHGNVLDSDEEEEDGMGSLHPQPPSGKSSGGVSIVREESRDSSMQDEDFAHVFGGDSDDDDEPDTQIVSKEGTPRKARKMDEVEDEFDFIVDDRGQPIRRRKEDGTFTEPMLMEAQEIFGLDFDPSEFEQVARDGVASDEEELDEEASDGESIAGSTLAQRKSRKTLSRKKKSTIYDVYEPSELERGHFLERDAEIRITDKPERFQVRSVPIKASETDTELEEEAEWVYESAFVELPISKQPLLTADRYKSEGPRRSHGGKSQQATVPKIKEVLNFIKNHSFEVPFIANYRREYIEPELDIHDLWKILRLDEKWTQLQNRKKNMKGLFDRMRDYQFEKVREKPDTALTEDTRVLTDEDIARLDSVCSDEELSDVYAHFLLYYGRDLVDMQNSRITKKKADDDVEFDEETTALLGDPLGKKSCPRSVKKARRKDFYSICQENGLGSLAAKFGLTPEQFGENLRDNYQRHETEQHQVEPEVTAEDYIQVSGYFSSVQAVLEGACHMVAMQISAEPLVRQALRLVFKSRAVLSVRPTRKGRKMIDDSHNCSSMRYLRNKPIKELKGDEFLRLHLAEQDHLLEVKISIDLEQAPAKKNLSSQRFFEEIRQLFYRDEFSLLVEKWNAQRAKAVAHALLKVLYPLMAKELRVELLKEAKEHVLQSCVLKFRKWLDMASVEVDCDEENVGPYMTVIACAYTHDKASPSFFCFLDSFGEVVAFKRFNNLAKRKYTTYKKDREEKEEDLKKLKTFVMDHHPDMIVVSAETRDSLSLVEEIRECVGELSHEEENLAPVPVELIEPHVARLFSKSRRGKDQFPDYPECLKMSISLGRQAQEPLQEFAALLSSQDDEVLALQLNPLQGELSSDQLKSALEDELVTRVNDVGVDIHYLQEHPHAVGMLYYICGLGPRKAAAILKTLKQEMVTLQNRSQLVTQCSIGPQVFINSAGFLRIDTSTYKANYSDVYIEVLDSTRVHPETYEWARKMAVDALEYDENDGDNPSLAVEDILKAPEKLRDLDLDAFAEELARQDYGNKRTTLYDIRNELSEPFKERRTPFVPLNQEEMFSLFTGETRESLYEGRMFTCTVVGIVRRKPLREVLDRANPIQDEHTRLWKCPFCLKSEFREIGLVWQHFDDGSCPGQAIGVRTRLENELSGFILTRNLSDQPINAPEERVHVGMTIYARVKSVNMDKFSVDMTSRSSDLADKEERFGVPKDVYYNSALAELDKRNDTVFKKPHSKPIQRVITHPAFQNITFEVTEKLLSTVDQGEAIFRPSKKSMENLTLTWKVDEGIYQHIDIREQDKPNKFSLGRSLLIGRETYEDLDEILARFVQPMASFAKDLLVHKCYRSAEGGKLEVLKKLLKEEKAKNPKRIPYFFSACKKLPGKFCLGYQPGSKARVEYVTVTPDGFRYRNKMHDNVDGLICWFKEHYQDPVPRPLTGQAVLGHGTPTSNPTPSSGSHIPSHITQNLDYPQLQAAVNTANQRNLTGSTPYTPTHLAYSTGTPTPQFGQQQQQYSSYNSKVTGGRGGAYPVQGAHTAGRGGGPFGGGTWRSGGGGMVWDGGRTPTQGGSRTPMYAASQTPQPSIGGVYGTSTTGAPLQGKDGRGQVGMASHKQQHNHMEPPGTPVLDE